MGKAAFKQVFKQYSPSKNLLLPSNLDELIDPHHLVRVVNEVVDKMGISLIINRYEGRGASAYHSG